MLLYLCYLRIPLNAFIIFACTPLALILPLAHVNSQVALHAFFFSCFTARHSLNSMQPFLYDPVQSAYTHFQAATKNDRVVPLDRNSESTFTPMRLLNSTIKPCRSKHEPLSHHIGWFHVPDNEAHPRYPFSTERP